MPRQSVYAASGVIILAAVLGVYFGVSRSLASASGLADEAGVIVPAVTPVASAKPILTPVQTMDETEVRKLAREEAQAILNKPVVHKTPSSNDDTDAAAPDQLTPVAPATVPLTPAKPAVPAPQG